MLLCETKQPENVCIYLHALLSLRYVLKQTLSSCTLFLDPPVTILIPWLYPIFFLVSWQHLLPLGMSRPKSNSEGKMVRMLCIFP